MINLTSNAYEVIEARTDDPFAYLGRHEGSKGSVVVRALKPRAEKVWILEAGKRAKAMPRIEGTDLFEVKLPKGSFESAYQSKIENGDGHGWEEEDP